MKQFLLLLTVAACALGLSWHRTTRAGNAGLPDAVSTATAAASTPVEPSFEKNIRPYLSQHCYQCHGGEKPKAELSLEKYKDDAALQQHRKDWDSVVEMLRSGEMPPKERPRPPADETAAVIKAIEAVASRSDCGQVAPSAGRVTIRRLNKTDYNNTIRDLLGIDFKPAADFPSDDVGYGFDNIGDVLTVSPLLLEKYLNAAETILDKAVVSIELPKLTRSDIGGLRVSSGAGERKQPGGTRMIYGKGDIYGMTSFDEGDYIIHASVWAQQSGDEPARAALSVTGPESKSQEFEVRGTVEHPDHIQIRSRMKAGTHLVAVSFLNPNPPPKNDDPAKDGKRDDAKPPVQRRLYARSLQVEGPFDPPPQVLPEAQRKLMTHREGVSPREAAREIVERFATRAFRRPVKPEEVERCLSLFDKAEHDGQRFENCVRAALYRVLVSPHFLFRVELDPPAAKRGAIYAINEYELASRMSYFLWSSMPDDELFALAGKGQLRANLAAQVTRMVKDSKSQAFVQSFADQWLTLRKLEIASPDPKLFPNFDQELRTSMIRESELFFEAIMREDHSILDLIDADFSFFNERLARHYGIDGIRGAEFRRVKLPANRGGILTQASILTLTSQPTRTSPVARGKWVLEQVFNTPPPPPPPDVPPLKNDKQLTGTLRQVMEQHRANAVCASCHARMDPVGFGFENYNAVGAWRDRDAGGFEIDSSGTLPDGKSFRGPAELKLLLKSKKTLFGRCVTEKMLTYALGRGLESYDRCAVDKIITALEKNDYRFSTLLVEVIQSDPFQLRTATGERP